MANNLSASNMHLTAAEKVAIVSFWDKIAPSAAELGAEALERLLPQIKAFFSHLDLSHGSADLLAQGGKVMKAIGQVVSDLDCLDKPQSALRYLRIYDLRLDAKGFGLLSLSLQVVFGIHFPNDFTKPAQAAWEKFLTLLSTLLTFKK